MINKTNLRRKINSLNRRVLKETYFNYDITANFETITNYITDETRSIILEFKKILKIMRN